MSTSTAYPVVQHAMTACRQAGSTIVKRGWPVRGSSVRGSQSIGRRPACQACRALHTTARTPNAKPRRRIEGHAKGNKGDNVRINYNTSMSFFAEPDPEQAQYRRVTAHDLAKNHGPPSRVKMLLRDFIDDSLYNPQYGYFSRTATIFTPPDEGGFDMPSYTDPGAFQVAVAARYQTEYAETEAARPELSRQVWHTPTELFKPHYAHSIISAILSSYKLNHYPYQDLILYEVGAGNGSFMVDSLAYIRDRHPEIYERTSYRIIEISALLAKRQRNRAKAAGVEDKVEIVNNDFFSWSGGETAPCYVVALEVLDNFAHDMIRYDYTSLEPRQAVVAIDGTGDFSLVYEPVSDPVISRYLDYMHRLPPSPYQSPPLARPLLASSLLRNIYSNYIPFGPNLSPPDFIPTKAMSFLEQLKRKLPRHKLLVADFSELPEAVPGRNGPVVQTRYKGNMVPCETVLVKQGLFDIFFPTNFDLLRDIYSLIMTSPLPPLDLPSEAPPASPLSTDFFDHVSPSSARGFKRRKISVYSHQDFLLKFGGDDVRARTSTKDGTWVMGEMYANAKVMF